MPSACFDAISNVPLLLVQWKNTGGLNKNKKPARLRRKNPVGTWYFTSAHNYNTILNINHLTRTRSVASLPCEIVWEIFWEIWFRFLPRNHVIIRGFSPWNGERFLSLGQCGEPSWEGGGGIVWLAAWKLVSNDAKRTVAPPNAKHSTLHQGCFLCFCFLFHSRFGNNAWSIPRNFPLILYFLEMRIDWSSTGNSVPR